MDLADLVPSKVTRESVENIKAFILKCRSYLEQNTFKVPDFVFKSKVPATINSVSNTLATSKSVHQNNQQKPQTKPKDLKELSSQKFSYATATKKGANPPQKPSTKNRIALTSEQITKIVDGVAPVESYKYKLVYFDGMKRSKITWVKQLLYQSQIRPYFMGNISWVEESKLEVCINEKMAPQLISYMESINGIFNDKEYSPLNEHSDDIRLNEIKNRFKWQSSDKNRNIPSRRMGNILMKLKQGEPAKFKEMFFHRDSRWRGVMRKPEQGHESPCDPRPTDIVWDRYSKDRGRKDRLLIWNVSELSAASVKRFVELHSNLSSGEFSVKKIKEMNSIRHELIYSRNSGIKLTTEEIGDVSKVLGAYIRPERNKMARGPKRAVETKIVLDSSKLKVMTFNIRGYVSKREEIDLVLRQYQPTLLMLQETNLNAKSNRLRIQGYQTVESKSHLRTGGRGLAIGVRKELGLSISELSQSPHWMATKISGTHSSGEKLSLIVVNLHMPHQTMRRKLVILGLTKYLRKLRSKKKKTKILLVGDFNKDIKSTVSILNRIGIGLRRAVVSNSKGSRMNNATMGRMIDHVAYTGFSNNPNYAKVLKSVDLSDHLPVIAEWNIENLKIPVHPKRIDTSKVKELRQSFTSNNRFAVLADQELNTENLVNGVTKSIYETAEELDALKTISFDHRRVLSKETLETIRKRRKAFKKLLKDPSVEIEYSDLKEKAIQLCRQDRMNNKKAEVKKACDLMLCNKSRELWSWLKRFSGRFSSSLVDGPIFDKNRQLITDSEAKAEVWASHFEELAKDSTGNSRSAKKWRDIGKNYTAEFNECDTPLSWAEICAALKSTPNNKSPGSDGIPSEVWKMVQYEDEPTSPLAKLILRLITGIWDAEKIPKQLDPSVVIPIPKKGDIRDPNNYRGISLIPTLSKVLSKIIARRLCKIDNKYSILAKEQAGFRTREECVAQATTLYEVVRRRKISGLSTWIGFIDFAKAYDRVPHEALLRKIKTAGIGG
ncbi:LINE-1 retrotransposable element ORF2 protein, partial [Smittium culicis]